MDVATIVGLFATTDRRHVLPMAAAFSLEILP
jgi:hypothetical protein